VARLLKKESMAGVFEKLAEQSSLAAQKEFLDRSKPESFQFVSFKIPKGGKKFKMGSPPAEADRGDDEALREVILDESFELQATPVTEYQKALLLGEDISKLGDSGNRPAVNINLDRARKLAERLTELDPDYSYRLPSEKEWEFAARAGTKTAYSFGNDAAEISDYVIHGGNSAGLAHEVATRKPNPAGLYDMHGNVWEWSDDLYKQGGFFQAIRGGSWNLGPQYLRSAQRNSVRPGVRVPFIGVRLLRTPK
jgi:formylglycine-generating enzyme required for sulfatase activity